MLLNILFGVLAIASLLFALYKLWCVINFFKKYEVIKKKILEMKKNKTSNIFISESLKTEGYDEDIISVALNDLKKS